jgi:hypothetical protein
VILEVADVREGFEADAADFDPLLLVGSKMPIVLEPRNFLTANLAND